MSYLDVIGEFAGLHAPHVEFVTTSYNNGAEVIIGFRDWPNNGVTLIGFAMCQEIADVAELVKKINDSNVIEYGNYCYFNGTKFV